MGISRYETPGSVAEACALLAGESGRTAVLGGGTDLVVDVRLGREIDLLVDIKRIPELNEIRALPGGGFEIGACVTMQQVAEDTRLRKRYPALCQAAAQVGSMQVRNRATLVGNLANASPCADSAPVLLVLGAGVRIADAKGGAREIPARDFICGVKKTVLKKGEIATGVVILPTPAGLRTAFQKLQRIRGHDLALLNAAGAFDPASGEIRVAIGSAAPTPILVPGLEGVCPPGANGLKADDVAERVAARALAAIRPISDVRASAEYRREMTAVLCRRLIRILLAEA